MLQVIILFFIMPFVKAIDILALPTDLGNALGIGSFAGGILVTLIILFTFISLPIYKKNTNAIIILGVLVLGFAVVVQWLSIFFLIMIILIIALGITERALGIFSERLRR